MTKGVLKIASRYIIGGKIVPADFLSRFPKTPLILSVWGSSLSEVKGLAAQFEGSIVFFPMISFL